MVSVANLKNGGNMKIEHVIPDGQKQQIEELQSKISEIEMAYAEKIKQFPFMESEIRKDMSEDRNIQMLRKAIADIYMRTTTKILIEAESEEELKRLKSMWRVENVGTGN